MVDLREMSQLLVSFLPGILIKHIVGQLDTTVNLYLLALSAPLTGCYIVCFSGQLTLTLF